MVITRITASETPKSDERRSLEAEPFRERVREIRIFDEVVNSNPYDRHQQDERDRCRKQEPRSLSPIAMIMGARYLSSYSAP